MKEHTKKAMDTSIKVTVYTMLLAMTDAIAEHGITRNTFPCSVWKRIADLREAIKADMKVTPKPSFFLNENN